MSKAKREEEIVADMESRKMPIRMQQSVVSYVLHRVPPGHFLTAVMSNNLLEAIGRADETNYKLLREWVRLFYNCDAIPSECWGSAEAVEEWLKGQSLMPTMEKETA
jgi:hypothetical protein